MPAEDRVVIHVSIDTNLARDKAKVDALLASIGTGARKADKDMANLGKTAKNVGTDFDKTGKDTNKMTKAFDKLKKAIKSTFDALGSFLGTFAKFSFIGVAIEIGLVGLALLSVKAALISGRLAMRAYQATLTGLGVTAAGVVIAISAAAAAFRQFQEVSLRPQFGGSALRTSGAVRATFGDRQLAQFGIEGLSGAVSALAQGGVTTGHTATLRKLGDFTQDPAQLQQFATIFAQVQRTGGLSGEGVNGLAGINPTLIAGLAELTGIDEDKLGAAGDAGRITGEVFDALISGQAEATDAFEGQLEKMSNTVIGRLKGMIPRLINQFADLGAPFLESISAGLDQMEMTVQRFLFLLSGPLAGFGIDKFLPGLFNAFDTISDWLAKLIAVSLPKIDGFISRMTGAWDTVVNFFFDLRSVLAPLEEGADLIIEVLGPFVQSIFGRAGFGGLVVSFNELLVNNKESFRAWGDAFGTFGKAVSDFFASANDVMVDLLPVWTEIFDVLAKDVMPIFVDLFALLKTGFAEGVLVVANAVGALGNVLRPILTGLTSLLSVPGLKQILGLLITLSMFSGGRSLIGGAVGGIAGLGRGSLGGAGGLMKGGGLIGAGKFGGAAMAGIGGALGAGALGFAAGSNVEGHGGLALGALGGAAIGAGVGTLIMPGLGTAIGAIGGALIGGVAAWFGQNDAEVKAGMAAKAMGDVIFGAIGSAIALNLAQGQGFDSFDGAMDTVTEALSNVGELAEKYGITEEEVITTLLGRRHDMLDQWDMDQRKLETGYDRLQRITGLTRAELEELANKMGVDVRDGILAATEAIEALGLVNPFDSTKPGQNFRSEGILADRIFNDPNSFISQNLVLPEQQAALDGLIKEATAFAPGELPSDLARQLIETELNVARLEHGAEGSELLKLIEVDIVKLFADAGHEEVGVGILGDMAGVFAEVISPDNPAIMSIRAAMEETVDKLPGLSETQRVEIVDDNMADMFRMLEGVPLEGLDDVISEVAEFWQNQLLVETIDANTIALGLTTMALQKLGGFSDADMLQQSLAGDRQNVIDWQATQAAAFEANNPTYPTGSILGQPVAGSTDPRDPWNFNGTQPGDQLGTVTKPMIVSVHGTLKPRGSGGPRRPGVASPSTQGPLTPTATNVSAAVNATIITQGMNKSLILRMVEQKLDEAARESAQRQTGTSPGRSDFRTGDNRQP